MFIKVRARVSVRTAAEVSCSARPRARRAVAGGPLIGLLLALALLPMRLDAAQAAEVAAAALDTQAVRLDMHRYFSGEKNGGIWLMSVGAPAAVAGAGLLFYSGPSGEFSRGMGYPLLALGAVEFFGGLIFYLNTNRRVPRFDEQLRTQPAAFAAAELARIRRVNRELSFLTAVELTLMVASGTMAGVGALRGLDTLSGVGTGLLVQSTVLFIYDQFAARRALRYTDSLLHFNAGIVTAPAGAGGATSNLAPRGVVLTLFGQY